VHSLGQVIVRQQIQMNFYIAIFTAAWLSPKQDAKSLEQKSVVDEALTISKSYFRDVAEKAT